MYLMTEPDYYHKRGDTSRKISTTLRDSAGSAVDISDSTILFLMRSFATGELKISGAANIVNGPLGQAEYVWDSADVDTAGFYFAEWQVTFPDGKPQTFPTAGYHLVVILEDLDTGVLTADQFVNVRRLRVMVAETAEAYTDALLAAYLERNANDLNSAAAEVWRDKAAAYSMLVDISIGGSRRNLSQLYDRARAEAVRYESLVATSSSASSGTRTREIERA